MTAGVELERDGTADDAISFEDARGGALGDSVGNFDEDAFGGKFAEGFFDGIPEKAGGGGRGQQKDEDECDEVSQARLVPWRWRSEPDIRAK